MLRHPSLAVAAPALPPPARLALPPAPPSPAERAPAPRRRPAGSYFTLSLFDKLWHPDLSQEEALVMMEKGIEEVKKRLVVAPAHYIIKVVDKEGIRTVKLV